MVESADAEDLAEAVSRLRQVFGEVCGRVLFTDAVVLAGYARPSFQRKRLVARAMQQLGWKRGRYRLNGALVSAYVRGSAIQRETILEVGRDEAGQVFLKERAP